MSGGPNIAVLGAGSIGCFVGGAWQAAGLPVRFIGRPKLSGDIHHHGLTLSDFSGWEMHLPPEDIDYGCEPDALADADVVLVSVKSGDTAAAAALIDAHAHDGATVVSLQNGISNVEQLEQGLRGRFEVARGMVIFNVAYLGKGRFHKGVAGDVWAEKRDATEAIAERVSTGPAALKISDRMLDLAWGKLLINLNNAVNALSGETLLGELQRRDYRRVFAAAMKEGLRLLRAAEIEPAQIGPLPLGLLAWVLESPDWLFNTVFFRMWKIDPKARSSMSDDLSAGRKTEVDYLNGELIRIAERLGRDAPVNRAIAELVHKAEAGAEPLAPKALAKAALGD